jgi:hypothetical protein
MSAMTDPPTIAVVVSRLPTLAVLVVGLLLVLRERGRRPGRSLNLGVAGLALLIGTTVGGGLVAVYRNELAGLRSEVVSAGELTSYAFIAFGLGNLVGLGLLVAALVSRVSAGSTAPIHAGPPDGR